MAKEPKQYTVIISRNGNERVVEGTLPWLTLYFKSTLEVGRSWQHEKRNRKINTNPKTFASLITNLNNAVDNAAANGNSSTSYR